VIIGDDKENFKFSKQNIIDKESEEKSTRKFLNED
jgi:hypothetical protein